MATLEDRIAALEAMVHELRAQLERPIRRDSLSRSLTCPVCGAGHVLGVREIKEHKDGGGLVPLAIGNKSGFWTSQRGAPLQAFICTACRFVEWYVASLDNLVVDGESVVELTRSEESAPPSDAPYR